MEAHGLDTVPELSWADRPISTGQATRTRVTLFSLACSTSAPFQSSYPLSSWATSPRSWAARRLAFAPVSATRTCAAPRHHDRLVDASRPRLWRIISGEKWTKRQLDAWRADEQRLAALRRDFNTIARKDLGSQASPRSSPKTRKQAAADRHRITALTGSRASRHDTLAVWFFLDIGFDDFTPEEKLGVISAVLADDLDDQRQERADVLPINGDADPLNQARQPLLGDAAAVANRTGAELGPACIRLRRRTLPSMDWLGTRRASTVRARSSHGDERDGAALDIDTTPIFRASPTYRPAGREWLEPIVPGHVQVGLFTGGAPPAKARNAVISPSSARRPTLVTVSTSPAVARRAEAVEDSFDRATNGSKWK